MYTCSKDSKCTRPRGDIFRWQLQLVHAPRFENRLQTGHHFWTALFPIWCLLKLWQFFEWEAKGFPQWLFPSFFVFVSHHQAECSNKWNYIFFNSSKSQRLLFTVPFQWKNWTVPQFRNMHVEAHFMFIFAHSQLQLFEINISSACPSAVPWCVFNNFVHCCIYSSFL